MKKFVLLLVLVFFTKNLFALIEFGVEEIVQAAAVDIDVGTYSTPSFSDWNNDGLRDLIIGDGTGKVRVFLNTGTIIEPIFNSSFFVQAGGTDLTVQNQGCLGSFPRVVHWNADAKKDLLVGAGAGNISIFINNGTDTNPVFAAGTFVQSAGSDINIGGRATSIFKDWNNDGKNDLIVGEWEGYINVFINENSNTNPVFQEGIFAKLGTDDLDVWSGRSSPIFYDLDADGKKDLVCGNTNGELLFYKNTNTTESPIFSNYENLKSLGSDIDLSGTPRSRPSFCNWNNDINVDVLIGAADGKVHLFRGVPEPTFYFFIFLFLINSKFLKLINYVSS